MAAHKAAIQRRHTESSQSFLPLGWMKPCDDEEGAPTVMQSTPTAGTRQMFSLPHHHCSSPEHSSWLLLTALHIYQNAAASVTPAMVSSTLPKASGRTPQERSRRDLRANQKGFEKQWASHPYRLAGVVGTEMTFHAVAKTRNLKSSRVMLESKVWVKPQIFIHIFSFKNVKAVAALQLTATACIVIAKACKIWYTL